MPTAVVYGINVLVTAAATGHSPFRSWPSPLATPRPTAWVSRTTLQSLPVGDSAHCAKSRTDLIVSNDVDLISMSPWRGTPIVTPDVFRQKVDGMRRHARRRH